MQTIPPPLPVSLQPNWAERNWMWWVPLAVAVVAIVIASFVFGVLSLMRSSEPYGFAIARAKSDPALIAALGEPLKDALWFTGNLSTSGESGRANLAIPISGPRGKATLYVVAKKSAGVWRCDTLVAQLEGGRRVDLAPAIEQPRPSTSSSRPPGR